MSSISTPYYRALDFTLIFVCCSIAYWFRFDTFRLPLHYFLPTTVLAITSMFSLTITDFYQSVNSESSPKQIIAATSGLVISIMITIACLYLTKTGEDYSRIWLVTSTSFILFGLLTIRFILKNIFRLSLNGRAIAILGSGITADDLSYKLENSSPRDNFNLALKLNQTIDFDAPHKALTEITRQLEQHRSNPNLKTITEMWVTHDVFSQVEPFYLEQFFQDSSIEIVYIPEIPILNNNSVTQVEFIQGIPTINSAFTSKRKLSALIKLLQDQILSWITLIFLAPLFLIIAIAIKLESKGPVIFRQKRHGLGGEEFTIYKFRTMNVLEDGDTFSQVKKEDPRVTKVGSFLRKTSLDELTQIVNVINGSMSIVGPRPHPTKLNDDFIDSVSYLMKRHKIKPGITGLAQVNGFRGETTEQSAMKGRIKYDLEYVNNWSLALDIKIIFLTVIHLFKTRNAY